MIHGRGRDPGDDGRRSAGGVRGDFKERVRFGVFRIPALYVTVEDLEGL